jgi:urease alpha subunit
MKRIRENGVLIITTPWEIYSKMENIKNKIIIDCWGIFKNKINILKNNKYVLIGKNINNKKL